MSFWSWIKSKFQAAPAPARVSTASVPITKPTWAESNSRKLFFDNVRQSLFRGFMSGAQVDGISRILDEWNRRQLTNWWWLAYMLATVYWETGRKMQPVREGGGEAYLRTKPYYPWVGEGLVQVTWKANALKFGATAPGQLMTWPIALVALFDGMTKGMFTGKKLSDYHFPDEGRDARRIINGTDKADEIWAIAKKFYAAVALLYTPH